MSFGQAVSSVYHNWSNFSGRAMRTEFWFFWLFSLLVVIGSFVVGVIFGRTGLGVVFLGLGLYWLITFIPNLAVTVRRLHDIGRSGWWLLIGLIRTSAVSSCWSSIASIPSRIRIDGVRRHRKVGPGERPNRPAAWNGQTNVPPAPWALRRTSGALSRAPRRTSGALRRTSGALSKRRAEPVGRSPNQWGAPPSQSPQPNQLATPWSSTSGPGGDSVSCARCGMRSGSTQAVCWNCVCATRVERDLTRAEAIPSLARIR